MTFAKTGDLIRTGGMQHTRLALVVRRHGPGIDLLTTGGERYWLPDRHYVHRRWYDSYTLVL